MGTKQTGPRSFTDERGLFKIELEPVRVGAIPGLDSFYSIGPSEMVWSPDSKFLLQTVYRPACPSQNPLALETVEVQTGNRSTIKDSICNCGSSGHIGWIRSDGKR